MSSRGQLPVIPSDPKSGGKRKEKYVHNLHNLNDLTVIELHYRAERKNIPGRSKMNKAQLVEALRKKH